MNTPYKVLLVDDERIIREGIASLVDWSGLGLQLVGCMTDGQAVLEELDHLRPDIVITDIKMPRVDGLELIKLAKQRRPDIKFVVLSGFGEFRFASKAMQYGVKHYILKPCDEDDIKKVLEEVALELNEERLKQQKYGQLETMLSEVMPKAREKWLSDYLLGRFPYGAGAATVAAKDRLQIGNGAMRLLLCRPDKELRYEEAEQLRRVFAASFGEEVMGHSALIDHTIVFVVSEYPVTELAQRTKLIAKRYEEEEGSRLLWLVSNAGLFPELPDVYEQAKRHMEQLFYLGGETDTAGSADPLREVQELLRCSGILANIQLGLREALNKELAVFFATLRRLQLPIGTTTGACIDLVNILYKQCVPQQSNEYLKHTAPILEMKTLEEVELYIYAEAMSILNLYYGNPAARSSMTARRMAQYVHDHLDLEELSLQWLAKHKLFMNADYLGKLFRKELNMPFPQYVAKARIDKARETLERSGSYKIYELAEMTGMGSDPKYFSNLFKKYSGCTPQEYKSRIAAERKEG
ncbi:response regulator [Paenibacillus sp. YIM B09110]|uniref:response regulator n=1 Tax=Paenibacillus sp. YIM B09110 TaxID=3126102 RepID=UPI00301C4A6C